ncbi:hypothetical protein [Sedimenticola hydrogenitrophicus]|uniref:hypothetical protein n=1 Tax=Sedimenticola hydrogenitrophicus TaxID=2967975 RepID=UPI0023B1AFCF|nr:hypothetical protein [Sedimenticola hydrogenitrophicus]
MIMALSAAGCGNQSTETANQADLVEQVIAQQTQAASPTANPHAGIPGYKATGDSAQPQILVGNQGQVKFVQQAGGYTYAEVTTDLGPVWVAANRSAVEVGQQVSWRDGAVMRNFHSKALDRSFPEIIFISSFITESGDGVQGKVISSSQSAGYSYLEVETDSGTVWLALPAMRIENGDRIRWIGGAEMQNFHSKTLDKTFDAIWFISSAEKLKSTG